LGTGQPAADGTVPQLLLAVRQQDRQLVVSKLEDYIVTAAGAVMAAIRAPGLKRIGPGFSAVRCFPFNSAP
jgi:hypothetical protein